MKLRLLKQFKVEELKKSIVKNLENAEFYEASVNIEKLKDKTPNNEVIFFYYYFYDLLEWVSSHKNYNNISESRKEKYFTKINEQNNFDKSITYLKLYQFLEKFFITFEVYTWFSKKEKSLELLNKSIKENSNNLETQFYILFCKKETEECFKFLNKNIVDIKIVEYFLEKIHYNNKFLDLSNQLRKKYNIDSKYSDFIYLLQKKDYQGLYDYFNNNKSEIYANKYISYGKVCLELNKYDESIKFYKDKNNKNNNDYYILGQCYEKKKQRQKAIKAYEYYYDNFKSGYWSNGIKKLFKLKAYDEIDNILKNKKFTFYKEDVIFYEAKLLNIKKQYVESINKLNLLKKYSKREVFLLYISNNYKLTINSLDRDCNRILENKDFEFNNSMLVYEYYASYAEFTKYIRKLNIKYSNKYLKTTEQYNKRIYDKDISLHQRLYHEVKNNNLSLSEDMELYYLSTFNDNKSLKKRIEIYKKRVKEQSENPHYHLQLGKVYYKKATQTNQDFTLAKKHLKKSIELEQKYFINLNGEAGYLLIKMSNRYQENEELFNNTMKNFIFHNSYQKDRHTTFFNQLLYKYQSFTINALSSLANNYLYFASPDQLNDPFDVASKSLEQRFENLKIEKKNFKTCSLSKNNNNKLMWSHYTDEHTGICVGYKFLYLPSYVGKSEVKYKNTNLKESDVFQYIADYWIVKSEDWEYEEEVRLLHYGNKHKINYTFNIEEAFQKKIVALQIASITLGMNFKEKNILKQTIKNIEQNQKSKIDIFKTHNDGQKLIIRKYNIKELE